MRKEVLTIGNKIEMTLTKDYTGETPKKENKYHSQLLEILSEQTVKIAIPLEEDTAIPLEIGEEYHLCFFTNMGLFTCQGKIKKCFPEKKNLLAEVELLNGLQKFQRRNYYRLVCMMSGKVRMISQEEEMLEKRLLKDEFDNPNERKECEERLTVLRTIWDQSMVIDLSGGGVRLQSPISFQVNDVLCLSLYMNDGKTKKKFNAKVVDSHKVIGEADQYETRAEFNELDIVERENLVKYIFEEQRKRIRKG